MKTVLFMPTLNEIEGLKAIMPRVKREWVDRIAVIDGGSTDGTIEWCRQQGYEVHVQEKRGAWDGYKQLYNALQLDRNDIIVTFSPDGNSIPEAIPKLVAKVKMGYSMVIASRYKDGAHSYDDTKFSRLGNRIFTTLINLLYGSDYTDALVIYRAYRAWLPARLGFLKPTPWIIRQCMKLISMTSWEIDLSIRCAKRGLMVAEIGADEPSRIGDTKQMPKKWRHALAIFTQFCYEIVRQ